MQVSLGSLSAICSLESYNDGAVRNMLRVPHKQAVVKIYKKKRSITMAIYFQSRSSWMKKETETGKCYEKYKRKFCPHVRRVN